MLLDIFAEVAKLSASGCAPRKGRPAARLRPGRGGIRQEADGATVNLFGGGEAGMSDELTQSSLGGRIEGGCLTEVEQEPAASTAMEVREDGPKLIQLRGPNLAT